MSHKKNEKAKKRLIEIVNMSVLQEQKKALHTLRKEIGASKQKDHKRGDDFTVSELIDNCHYALQTASMIEMCKTASRNFWIALIATVAAVISAIAAWVVVMRN